ncbi:hypothetical protein MK489_09830 [Myxococcota bacterium]|nr:hypothetical protein [Myxococcota bacterium]
MARARPTSVILLGGQENALSILRSLHRHGVPVILSAPEQSWALRSRYCHGRHPIPEGMDPQIFWEELLIGPNHPQLRGCVILACSDDAIEFMAMHRSELRSGGYILDDHVSNQQLQLLNRHITLELASLAGIPTPRHWAVERPEDIEAIESEIEFPAVVVPKQIPLFERIHGKKRLLIDDFSRLLSIGQHAHARGIELTVCENIPGPDDLASRYSTYIDRQGNALFRFTRRILKCSSAEYGKGVHFRAQWLPETAEIGEKFFRSINFTGLGTVDLKQDPRNGELKLIHCDARFTSDQELLIRSNLDSSWIIYNHLAAHRTIRPAPILNGARLWCGYEDFNAFRELRARNELDWAGWIRSIARPAGRPYFSFEDPHPALAKAFHTGIQKLRAGRQGQVNEL